MGSANPQRLGPPDLRRPDVLPQLHKVEPAPGGDYWVSVGQVEVPPDQIICVFRPESDRTVPAPEKVQEMFGQVNDRTCVVSIEFTDANGSDWERDPRGALVSRELSGQ
jgi:hypothetical protein